MADAEFTIGVTTAAGRPRRSCRLGPLGELPGPVPMAPTAGVRSSHTGDEPLAKSASGGELSRVISCPWRWLAGPQNKFTMVFDEIDAGVGAGLRVYRRALARLARTRQAICRRSPPMPMCT